MRYVTGIHALNTECSLETTGGWHMSALQWHSPTEADTETTKFKDWGIEYGNIPTEEGTLKTVPKANHLRALLDILAGDVSTPIEAIKFFRNNYLGTDKYDDILFEKVTELKDSENWSDIYTLMAKEYGRKWTKRQIGV